MITVSSAARPDVKATVEITVKAKESETETKAPQTETKAPETEKPDVPKKVPAKGSVHKSADGKLAFKVTKSDAKNGTDFGQTIGALAGVLPREPDAPAAPLPGEMLVMAHFRPGLLEGMLQGWRAAHIPPVALKAMLTDTNAAWTAPALYAEIAKEHAAMHSGGRAHKA